MSSVRLGHGRGGTLPLCRVKSASHSHLSSAPDRNDNDSGSQHSHRRTLHSLQTDTTMIAGLSTATGVRYARVYDTWLSKNFTSYTVLDTHIVRVASHMTPS